MIRQFKGTSQVALLAEGLPVHARVGLALIAADLALPLLAHSHNSQLADEILTLAQRWHEGKAVSPEAFVDVLEPEEGVGISLATLNAKSDEERLAWLVLASAAYYAAYHAHKEVGYPPNETVAEVDERELDNLDASLRRLSPTLLSAVGRAAELLKERPNAGFSELKSAITSPGHHRR